jgi:hypothetical protein
MNPCAHRDDWTKGRLTMKKYALAAAALAGVTAFTGASAAPATAPVAEDKAVTVLRWRLIENASHQLGENAFAGSDTIRSVRTGKIVGYDSYTARFFPQTNKARFHVAAAVRGGILVAALHGTPTQDVFNGRVIRGTGKFAGAEGTVVAKPEANNRVLVTIRLQ